MLYMVLLANGISMDLKKYRRTVDTHTTIQVTPSTAHHAGPSGLGARRTQSTQGSHTFTTHDLVVCIPGLTPAARHPATSR